MSVQEVKIIGRGKRAGFLFFLVTLFCLGYVFSICNRYQKWAEGMSGECACANGLDNVDRYTSSIKSSRVPERPTLLSQ